MTTEYTAGDSGAFCCVFFLHENGVGGVKRIEIADGGDEGECSDLRKLNKVTTLVGNLY